MQIEELFFVVILSPPCKYRGFFCFYFFLSTVQIRRQYLFFFVFRSPPCKYGDNINVSVFFAVHHANTGTVSMSLCFSQSTMQIRGQYQCPCFSQSTMQIRGEYQYFFFFRSPPCKYGDSINVSVFFAVHHANTGTVSMFLCFSQFTMHTPRDNICTEAVIGSSQTFLILYSQLL
jgi:hypothetical protein